MSNKIHITDDKTLNERMNRIYQNVWNILEEEKVTAKDILWLVFLLKEDVRSALYESEL